jgi:hypothetical protein
VNGYERLCAVFWVCAAAVSLATVAAVWLHVRDQEQTNRACIASGGQVILDNCVRGGK